MRKLYFIFLSAFVAMFSSFALGQGTIYKAGSSVSGTTLTASTSNLDSLMYPKDLYFVNESGSDADLRLRRVILCSDGTLADEQLCYNWGVNNSAPGLCFQPTAAQTDYTTPMGGASPTIAGGDTLWLEPKQDGIGSDAAVKVILYVVDEASGDMLDSVYINYLYGTGDCTVGVEEAELKSDISAYPNPANGFVNFNVELQGAQNAELAIVDMLGKQVYVNRVSANQNHKVNTSTFKQGIYFYSIKVGGQVLETKKLVVKH